MKQVLLAIGGGVVLVLLSGCDGGSGSGSATNDAAGNPLTAPVDYIGAAGRAKLLAEKTADLAGVSQAVQIFVAQEGRYPKDLDELVKEQLLTQIPKAPYGTKMVYDPKTGKVSIVPEDAPATNAPAAPTR